MRQPPDNPPTYFTNEHAKAVGKNIREVRGKQSQEEVGTRMFSNGQTVYHMERGESLTLPNIILLCQALNCTIEELLPNEFKPLASRAGKEISMVPAELLGSLSDMLSEELQRRGVA